MGQTLRLLVVEDEVDLAESIRRYFEHQGQVVALARGGIDALRVHLAQPVDVALIDLSLREGDGLSVLRELRRAERAPECIIITGHGTLASAVESTRLGAADFVAKPFQFTDLDVRVRSAVARRTHAAPTPDDVLGREIGRDVVPEAHPDRAPTIVRRRRHGGKPERLVQCRLGAQAEQNQDGADAAKPPDPMR